MDKDSNNVSPQDDGAGEQLVEEKNGHKGVEVKYMSPQNGDAKIDIENLKTAFAGMGKEELMKFANDPFWVKTRWFLFILFWLLWVAMLAGAIAIIVLAPRCAPPSPREWWEKSPLYKANVDTFAKDTIEFKGNLREFTTKLDYFNSLGVKTVVLSNILKVSDENSDGIDEFKNIAPAYGTLEDLKQLITKVNQRGLQLLLTLIPNHSSLKNSLFNQSLTQDSPFANYYVWAPSKGFSTEGVREAPNNWRSKDGDSAWEWSEARQAFYLHQFGKHEPEFNFHNPDVIKYFNDVMQFWLNLGVSGFYLERTPYLLEDPELRNESVSRVPSSATYLEYDFYSHSRTSNLPDLQPLLANWKSLVANSSGVLVVDDVSNQSVAHVVVRPQTLKPYPEFTVDELLDQIKTTLATNSWPVWQIRVENEKEESDLSKGLLLFSMLLPGIPVTLAGQELGVSSSQDMPWRDSTGNNKSVEVQEENKHSFLSAYKELVRARDSPSVLHGSLHLHRFNGTSVIAYTQLKSGSPGYLVVFNVGTEETVVDVSHLDTVPDELTLLLTSDTSPVADKTKVESAVVTLPGRAVAVFSFVPKDK